VGSIAADEVLALAGPLRAGAHLQGTPVGRRLGGGAAGTGLPLVYAGHEVAIVTAVGDDEAGAWLMHELARAGAATGAVACVPGSSTHSLVLLDPGGERTVVNLHRCREPEPPRRVLGLPADCLYVRSRELELAPLIDEKARACRVVAHVPPVATGGRPAHVLLASASDLAPEALARPWALGREIAGDRLEWFVVTRGAAGAEAHAADRTLAVGAPAARVADTTGAGDAFAAGLVHALVTGAPMERALRAAVAWGTASVGHRSSVLPRGAVEGLLAAG
jgi:sugar/nucleoside kinase (ribokinase family)